MKITMRCDSRQDKEERTLLPNDPDLIFLNDTIMTVLLSQQGKNRLLHLK